jgi:hypothetical protein
METFLQNNWYWWETNDKYVGTWTWQVLEAKSININKSSKYFYNSNWNLPTPEDFWFKSWNPNIKQILFWASNSQRVVFFSSWEIRSRIWLVITIPKTIINAWVIWNIWFVINSDGTIWYWTYDKNANDLWIWSSMSYYTLWLSIDLYFAPYLIDWDFYI